MSKTILHEGDKGVSLIIRHVKSKQAKKPAKAEGGRRSPVHVVYGGAHLFAVGTTQKFGEIALRSLKAYAPNSIEFGTVFNIEGNELSLAATVYERTRRKLETEPVEDFRIDFEDGYGFRADEVEDADAERSAGELAAGFREGSITTFSGFRIKSYASETRERARRTLNIFLDKLLEATKGKLPQNFVVTLPKITEKKEVSELSRDLKKIEKMNRLKEGSVKIELMIEHPLAIIDKKGNLAVRNILDAARGRCVAAHFGAYDYTAALGIAASYQDISHPACDLARQIMLVSLKPLGMRLSDSITPEMPVPTHKGEKLSEKQKIENKAAVIGGWRAHFSNIRRSMAKGFYQSWDLHPNQLVARYAAVYSFFLENLDAQGARLRSFIDNASQATLTGQHFDDAATAMGLVNFFRQGLDCAAFDEEEIKKATGLSAAELGSFPFKGC